MATRAAPGGASTISLGCADSKESFDQRREERSAVLETPDATPRFPQAPGGDASICLRGDAVAAGDPASGSRGPVGGATSLVLGSDGGEGMFKRHAEDYQPAPSAEQPPSRFRQAPGGDASVSLGSEALPRADVEEAARCRGPVGGASSIVLGTDEERFPLGEASQADVEPLAAAPRFQQAPGGTSSICLRGDAPAQEASCTRGPVGGAANVVLGNDSAQETFAERQQEREAAFETPAAAPRFQQAPGGASSISLGVVGSDSAPVGSAATSRPPAGGAATVVLGGDDSKQLLSEYADLRDAGVDTPEALPRFSQAPGGSSTVCLGASDSVPDAVTVRGPVGGATSICLGGDAASLPRIEKTVAPRGPVGGVASVVLGTDDAKDVFNERLEQRELPVETPAAAAPRFQQVPGGTASICLGGDGAQGAEGALVASRGPVGGVATVVLGSDDCKEAFVRREEERAPPASTPEASPRFTQAPGGNATVSWTCDGALDAESDRALSTRGPVGGATSVHLGGDDPAVAFRLHESRREACVETPDAAPRFQQAPGGASTLSLGGGGTAQAAPAVRGPVGGEATIVFGAEGSEEAFRGREQPAAELETPAPAPRFQQAPGGDASICLGAGGSPGAPADAPAAARGEVGGPATVVLGIDDSEEILRRHEEQRQAIVETPAAAARFPQAPGGTAQILLAGGAPEAARGAGSRCAPGGAASLVLGGDYPDDVLARRSSSNAFATGSNQNCGNVLTERPTTRLHQAPGGTATIKLGDDVEEPSAPAERVSANSFASGASQNTGNVLTDRSTTRLHQAPGGASTLCLGGDYPEAAITRMPGKVAPSANCFASGANPNCGNAISERPTTRLHQAPGGNSTLCLGAGEEASGPKKVAHATNQSCDENRDTINVAAAQQGKDAIKPGAEAAGKACGGEVVLG